MFDLSGKTALITGSSKGLGLSIAKALFNSGATIILNGRNPEALDLASQEINPKERIIYKYPFDVTNVEDVNDNITKIKEKIGTIDILVNNAGHNITENFQDISEESFDRMLNVHVKGTFFMTQAVYRDMIKRGNGRIINITSQLAYKGAGELTHYCAAKGANTTFTRALALECAGTGVLVNAVAPGVTNTDLLTPLSDNLLDTLKAAIPLNRFAEVDEIAPAVAFLASPEGSFFHGSCISPNGGEVMF